MKGLSFLFSAFLLCSRAGAAETPKFPELRFDAMFSPGRVQVVRSGRVGCEPGCAEWISLEGLIDRVTAQRFAIAVNSLHGRKLPLLIHSAGGSVSDALRIGALVRARGFDVVVARTEFDPCSNSSGGCKEGDWSGVRGQPSLESAYCFSACAFVLAGGVHRMIRPGAQIAVHSIFIPKMKMEEWHQVWRGKIPLEDIIQFQVIPGEKPMLLNYFKRMGIAPEIVNLIYATPSTELRVLSESDLTQLKLVTDLKAGQSLMEQLAK